MESDSSEGLSRSIGAYKHKSYDDTTITSGDKKVMNEMRKKIVFLQNELNKYKVKSSIVNYCRFFFVDCCLL